MIEEEIRRDTPVGRECARLYETGQLVPDEIVVRLIEARLDAARGVKGFIFKGFPRTLVQSYILEGLLGKYGAGVSEVLELQVPTLELVRRLDERSRTDRQMPYDSSAARIVRRLQEHETRTLPVIDRYRQHRGVTAVDGTGTFEAVFERLRAEVEAGLTTLR